MNSTFQNKKTVWISWHAVPRSRNIAKYLGIPLYEYHINDNIFKRHFNSSIWTIKFMLKQKPDVVFLHYSYLLLFFVVLYKKFFDKGIVIIADCHNKALRRKLHGFGSYVYEKIKKFSFKNSDMTIVTNKGMIPDIVNYNKNYFILPDKIPDFELCIDSNKDDKYCVYISTFAIDEPINEIFEVANILDSNIKIFWTGKKSNRTKFKEKIPDNIVFTGFLDYQDYYKLLTNADAILVLTYEDNCLQCGAYEGLNTGVPLVISDNEAAREYFQKSAIYTKIEANSIADSLRLAMENSSLMKLNSKKIKFQRNNEYMAIISTLLERVRKLISKSIL